MNPGSSSMQAEILKKVENENKQKIFAVIQQARGNADIEEYKQAFRAVFWIEGLFNTKKSRQYLEKSLQQLNPSLQYSNQVQLILKNIGKIFLMELFEQAIQARQKMIHKRQIDEQVLDEAYRRLKEKVISQKF